MTMTKNRYILLQLKIIQRLCIVCDIR